MIPLDDENTELHPLEFAELVAAKLHDDDDTPADTPEAGPSDEVVDDAAGAEAPTPDAAPEPTDVREDDQGRLRGPDGKFVAKADHEADPDAQPDPEATPEPDEWVLEVDPDVESFLEKYDGDLNKALRGAIEAQKLVGKQGSELGELRKVQSDLEALREEIRNRSAQQVQPQVMPDYGELIQEDPRAAAVMAYENQHYDAMGHALRAWMQEDPVEARLFAMNVKHEADMLELRAQQAQRDEASRPDPEQALGVEVAKVMQRHPDLEQFLPAIGEVSAERPLLRAALENGTPAQRAEALETLYLIARGRQGADTSEAVRRVQVRVSDEARQARAEAAVVSASGASAATGDQPTKADEFRSAFTDKLREQGLYGE